MFIYTDIYKYKKTSLTQVNQESKYIGVTFINICTKIMNKIIYNTWTEDFNFKYQERGKKKKRNLEKMENLFSGDLSAEQEINTTLLYIMFNSLTVDRIIKEKYLKMGIL